MRAAKGSSGSRTARNSPRRPRSGPLPSPRSAPTWPPRSATPAPKAPKDSPGKARPSWSSCRRGPGGPPGRAGPGGEQRGRGGGSSEIPVEPPPDGFTSTGADRIEFMVATNAGMPASPLRDAASGGELSRVMLALTGLAAGAGSPTLVFDEVDAGVGGKTARAVGARLRALGSEAQVVCITHLPQVASQASAHFRITKSSQAGETRAAVERVDGEELVAEIVRMLGSERGDEAADRHARELLAAA